MPRSTSVLQDYLLNSIATTIQDVDFPLNDLQESIKATSSFKEFRFGSLQASKPTRIIVLEGVDEELAFDELRAALMVYVFVTFDLILLSPHDQALLNIKP